ncbi:Zn-dependent hydrolase [Terasakiella pusilla]|uniref:Zn-dependent hydrolase n=1 Tax=Terasakiella pusilla TaxID=64973 RepID=UPI00056F900F|nr:Zn-dependent hydrolase [Terasakiella pusilla]
MSDEQKQNHNWAANQQRLWDDLMALGELTEPGIPYTRRSFSEMFLKGRDYLTKRFEEAGLDTFVDENGNLIGRLEGTDPERGTLMIGSHSDTVPGGGRFDGVAGVVAGLEVARALKDAGIRLKHNLEIVDCLAEEMSEYGLSCIGTRGMTGQLKPEMLDYKGPNEESLRDAITRMGGKPDAIKQESRKDIKGYLELHIEQGKVLETAGLDIGVVTTIVGITRIEITVKGLPDHAGTTPMDLRKDALSGAVEIIAGIRDKAKEIAKKGEGYFVATTGEVTVEPNAANVVPSTVKLVIDSRAQTRVLMEEFLAFINDVMPNLATAQGVEVSEVKILSDSLHSECDDDLSDLVKDMSDQLGLTSMRMTSGAGHDAAFFSRIAPTAMVFVPCKDGRSHCPEEWSEPEQIAAGTAVVFETLCKMDAR